MELENSEDDETVVLNNLLESQLKIASEEAEDLAILEKILFASHERAFCALEKGTSNKIYKALQQVEDARMVQCTHCNQIFTNQEHEMHVCLYNENQQLVPLIEVFEENETELGKTLRCTLSDLSTNREKAANLVSDAGKNMECPKCCRKFVHESGLYRHWDKHIGELLEPSPHEDPNVKKEVVLCLICGEVFTINIEAITHMLTHHFEVTQGPGDIDHLDSAAVENEEDNKSALQVNTVTSTQSPLKEKTRFISKPKKNSHPKVFGIIELSSVYQCEFCESVFKNFMFMLLHASKHAPIQGYGCKKCELNALPLKDLLIHRRDECIVLKDIRNSLRDFPRLWVCNICYEEFQGLEHLVIHRNENFHFFPRIEPKINKLVFSCQLCLDFFHYAPDLVDHYDEKHCKKIKPEVPLETSERILKEPTNHRGGSHQTSSRARGYLCEVCGKSYTQSSHLWQHLRFHQGIKPFSCSVEGCNRKFTIRPDLNDHVRKCHTGERPYLCTICGKRFLTGSVYYQHRLIHRGERRYGCEECEKRFYRADALKNHMRIHTGEKPHSCSECGKTFRQRGDRDKHIKARHPGATIIPSPRKQRVKSFGRGRIKNNTSLYQSMPTAQNES